MFANLKHNTSLAIDGDAFATAHQGLRPPAHNMVTPSGSPTASPHRHVRRTGRQDASHGVFNVSPTHSRRDPFNVDYGLWPFDDRDYDIVCTVTNNVVNTDLSLWTPLLSGDARRQACVQDKDRCCNFASTEHNLRWCPAPFKNTLSLLNPEFGTHILMYLYLRRGRQGCVAGARPPPADVRITIDVTTQVMAAHVTPIIGDTTRHTKVTPQGCHAPRSLPMRGISSD